MTIYLCSQCENYVEIIKGLEDDIRVLESKDTIKSNMITALRKELDETKQKPKTNKQDKGFIFGG